MATSKPAKPKFVAESICVPGDANITHVPVSRPMPCVVIFVHGVNSEGEWYHNAEQGLINGLNKRLGRVDLKANGYKYGDDAESRRPLDGLDLKNSPVIRFYWGYRAPVDQTDAGTFPWRIPLKTRVKIPGDPRSPTYKPYDYPTYSYKKHLDQNKKGAVYYWGGGPFQNGTTALNLSWCDGFNPEIAGVNIGSTVINPERYRPLNACPKRTYYVNASKRLARLIDTIYEKNSHDTVAVVSHSQGTMIAMLAMFYITKRVPDALFICNSPYRLEKFGMDSLQFWERTPTTRSRVKTFYNLLELFQKTHPDIGEKTSPEIMKGVGGWLDPAWANTVTTQAPEGGTPGKAPANGTPESETPESDADHAASIADEPCASVQWRQDLPVEKEHANHGRVFVYCSPDDRVMGATPLMSIGWRGVADKNVRDPAPGNDPANRSGNPFEKYGGVLFQRQFMRSYGVGYAPKADTPRYFNDGRPPWDPPSPKIMGLFDELASPGSVSPSTINVNGPAVPEPIPGGDPDPGARKNALTMAGFTDPIGDEGKPISKQDDFKYYEELLYDKPEWVQEQSNYSPSRSHMSDISRRQTPAEEKAEFDSKPVDPTSHSTTLLYKNSLIVERVLAYDLPIGRANCFSDDEGRFWQKLLRMADWLEEGGDTEYAQGGDYANAGENPPDGVDRETDKVQPRSLYFGH